MRTETKSPSPAKAAALDTPAAAFYLGVSASWLAKLRHYGGGPEYLKLGRRVVYKPGALDAWADQGVRASTSDERAA